MVSALEEPPRPPSPEPTFSVFTRCPQLQPGTYGNDENDEHWTHIEIRLVGTHPLWGHYLSVLLYSFTRCIEFILSGLRWNAARSVASYLDENPHLYRDRNVLELGAGGGLPGIVTIKNGAQRVRTVIIASFQTLIWRTRANLQVVLTDYPDSDLIKNLEYNVLKNIRSEARSRVSIQVSKISTQSFYRHNLRSKGLYLGSVCATVASSSFEEFKCCRWL
jgi:EEF1A N-terminal glycine/lysine methyltransferase